MMTCGSIMPGIWLQLEYGIVINSSWEDGNVLDITRTTQALIVYSDARWPR